MKENVSSQENKTYIYRKKGHPQNSEQGQGWEETQVNDTLNAFDNTETRTPTIIQQTVYENHSQDTRYKELGDVCQPISATFGMGGNNQPFVVKEVFDASRRHNYEPFGDISGTVQAHFGTGGGNVPVVVEEPILLESNQNHATIRTDGVSTTLSASMGMGGGYVPMISDKSYIDVEIEVEKRKYEVDKNKLVDCLRCHKNINNEDIAAKLNCPLTMVEHWFRKDEYFSIPDPEIWPRLKELLNIETDEFDESIMTFEISGGTYDSRNRIYTGETAQTFTAQGGNDMRMVNDFPKSETVVRRLTPLECERLQGYPDHWTDIGDWVDSKGKTHKGESDSPRYKALGNSIALPFWQYMAEKMVAQYDRPTTMASLFDGIGGFPLVFSRCGCEPIWASEIEEFPIAVTKIRFPEKEE